MANNIDVLVVEPQKEPYMKTIPDTLESLQKEVGGYIQAVYPWDDPVGIICDEEAKLKGSPLNRALRDEDGEIADIIAGTFMVVGLGEENFASLNDTEAKKFASVFKTPETFIRINDRIFAVPMKPSLKDRLNAAKATANEQNKDNAVKSRGKDKEETL